MSDLIALKELCLRRNLDYQIISGRVNGGWSKTKALKTPSKPAMELVLHGICINLRKYCSKKNRNYLNVLRLIYTLKLPIADALKLSNLKADRLLKERIKVRAVVKTTPGLKAECEKKGMDYHVVFQRIKTGWSKTKALNTPINTKKPFILNGVEINLSDYCKKHKLNLKAVQNRYYYQKMSLEDAVDFSKGNFHKKYKLNGKVINLKQESIKRNLAPSTVVKRIYSGKTVKRALEI